MIRGLIFDCFGVLYVGSLQYLRELSPPERHDELADLSRASDYGYVSSEEYLTQMSAIIGKSPDEVAAVMKKAHVRNESLVMLIRRLKSQYKIGLLSNVGQDVIERLFTEKERAELFDAVILSSTVHMTKPDPAIFSLAVERLGLAAEECVMIDDLLDNIDGAERAGLLGIVYGTQRDLELELARRGVSTSA